MTSQTSKARINRELKNLGTYHDSIPLDKIFGIVREHAGQVLDVDGTPWAGFLCGSEGSATFKILNVRFSLRVDWFTMQSGRYEITAYVS